jgi:hypothetical protein
MNEVVVFQDEVVVWLNEVAVLAQFHFQNVVKIDGFRPSFEGYFQVLDSDAPYR